MPGDKSARGQIKDQAAIHLFVEVEVEVVEGFERVTELGLLAPAFQHPVGAAGQFIRHQTGDQIQGGHGFGLGLAQTSFQDGGHASQT